MSHRGVLERKSRRTHKNSRDGCPNCKAKRIKCTEELPECLNCLKKNYRCGYMDFSDEKLEMIRRKNERKNKEHVYEITPVSSDGGTGKVTSSSAGALNGLSSNSVNEHSKISTKPDALTQENVDLAKDFHDQAVFSKIYGHFDHQFPATPQASDQMFYDPNQFKLIPNISINDDNFLIDPSVGTAKTPLPWDNFSANGSSGSHHQHNTNGQYQQQHQQQQQQQLQQHQQQQQHYSSSMEQDENYGSKDVNRSYGHQHNVYQNGSNGNMEIQQGHGYQYSGSDSSEKVAGTDQFQIPNDGFSQSNYQQQQDNNFQHPQQVSQQFHLQRQHSDHLSHQNSHQHGSHHLSNSPTQPQADFQNNDCSIPTSSASSTSVLTHSTTPSFNTSSDPLVLPNGILHKVSLPKVRKIDKLKNTFLHRYLKHYQSDIRHLNNLEFRNAAPVWNHKIAENFWTSVYNQSVVLDLYYSFFMDRSLNALLHRCKLLLNDKDFLEDENIFFLNQPQDLLYKYYFFTPRDLDILVKKSYSYYGFLIKDLRESLLLIHAEYPAKISLFAAWSTFLHSHSSVDTFCLLFSGTTTLFLKVFNTARSLNQIPPTINTAFYIFINHSNTSLIPDYDFQVIKDLHQDVIRFKKISQNLSIKFLANDNDKIIVNVKIARHCFDLEIFLRKLIEEYLPQIVEVNNRYKRKFRRNEHDNNIYFVRVKLFYELLSHWFSIYPSEAIPVGSKYNAMWKTFYLFFNAIGKALSHILTPIRSLMLVDPNNTFCPRSDFDPKIYKIEQGFYSDVDFAYYQSLSSKLIRITTFFNNRTLFYSYYLSTVTVLDQEYIKMVSDNTEMHSNGDDSAEPSDVLQIMPEKIQIDESFLHSFDNSVTIMPENYPIMEHFREEFEGILSSQREHQKQDSLKNEGYGQGMQADFCFEAGSFKRDFNPEKWIELIIMRQKQAWEDERITLSQSQIRMHYFDLARHEVNKSIK